jgi:uncharacterized protein YbjQ (UPF0145 family)
MKRADRPPQGDITMATRVSFLCALVAGSLFALAGAAHAQTSAPRGPDLRQYTFSELNQGRYEVVTRQWGDNWRSAFSSPTFPTREQAVAALNSEAAARGADALLNVTCLDQGHWKLSSNAEPAILCYAIAIRIKPS